MMTKLKNAPNMKKQPQDVYSVLLVAGSQAWDFAKMGAMSRTTEEMAIDKILPTGGNIPPIVLDDNVLKTVYRYRIAPPTVQAVTIQRANNAEPLKGDIITALCLNLAKHTTAKTVIFTDEAGAELENVSGYIERLRTDDSTKEIAQFSQKTAQNAPLTPETLSDKPSQRELLNHFLAWNNAPLKRDVLTGQTYRYNGLIWGQINDEELRRLVLKFFEEYELDYSQRKINAITELVLTKIEIIPTAGQDLTAYQNGALNKATGEFIPLSPELNLRHIEDFSLNLSLETPNFDQWLSFVTDDGKDTEKQQAILAGLYMILTNRYKWQLFIEVIGIAGSGKSIFGNIATLINGKSNTAFLELKRLEQKPENRYGLLGKTLMYSPDQPYYKGDGDTLKALTGGEVITVKSLYSNPIEIQLNTCVMMTTNYPLLYTDKNGGISRRRIIISFNRKVPTMRKDENLLEKIQAEIYGITNRLLAEFPNPETAKAILEKYRLNNDGNQTKKHANHLIDFASAFEVRADKPHGLRWGSTRTKEENFNRPNTLYKAYLFYCDCCNLHNALSLSAFKQAFPDALKESGQQAEMIEIKLNGYPTLNVHFKHKEETFREWEG